MHSIPLTESRPRIGEAASRIKSHLRTPLYANAYILILNQFGSAGLGILYWLVAARFYSAEVVGQNSAIISAVMFIAALADLGLQSAMTRFVPRAGVRISRLIAYTYGINLIAAAAIGTVFFWIGAQFQFTENLVTGTGLSTGWLILAAMVWCLFYLQDGILTGMRQAIWVLIKNTFFNFSKLLLLIVGLLISHDYGIVSSWFLPPPFLIIFASALIFWKFIPKYLQESNTQLSAITSRLMFTSVTGDYIGTLMSEVCVRILPLLVINLFGKSTNAYFYQAWLIASMLQLIASGMTKSFTVEASADLSQISAYSRRILLHMARLIVPMAVIMFVAAPLGLGLFGEAYAREGTALLRWLALAQAPMIMNIWYLSYARVRNDAKVIMFVQGTLAVLTLGLAYFGVLAYGITGIGIAWFGAQTLVAVVIAFKTFPLLLAKTDHPSVSQTLSRNHLLRRVDWRFLLFTPEPQKSVCFTDGFLAESVREISKQSITVQSSTGNDCDLAVAVNPDQSTLHAAYRALRTGGACYTEWDAWRAGGPGGIRRRLAAAGFTQVQLYWSYPNPIAPRMWLAVQSDLGPYRYLANQFFTRGNLVHCIARAILPILLRVALRIGLVPHLSATASKGTARDRNVFDLIRDEWSRIYKEPPADSLSFLMQTGGSQLCSKIICLVFAFSEPDPRWVVKLPRVPEDTKTLQNEQSILGDLHHLNNGTSSTLVFPRVLFRRKFAGVWVTGQTGLSGVPLNVLLQPGNLRDLASKLTDCQVTLAKQSRARPRTVDGGQVIERLTANLDELANFYFLEPDILAQTRSSLSILDSIPLVCAHSDFTPWNVMLMKEGLGVFDWTDADWDSPPALDLVYVLANLAFTLERSSDAPSRLATYQRLLDPCTTQGAIFQQCLARYATEIGLQSCQIAPLRLLTWVLHSNFEFQNQKTEHGGQVPFASVRESVCIPLWKAELQLQVAQRQTAARFTSKLLTMLAR